MNPTDENLPTIDQRLLDLLVDGELTEPERRDLLAKLDETPGGWRRCALAFLEAQCWKEGLGLVPRHLATQPHASPASRRPRSYWGKGVTVLAIAASFLIALALGGFLRDAWRPPGRVGPGPMQFATVEGPQDAAAKPEQLESRQPDNVPTPGETGSPLRYVRLPLAGGPDGVGDSIRLPATETDSIDEAWLESLPRAIPAEVLEAFRRSGHQVHQQRGLMPFALEDGRQLVVPYDEVDIRYVGNTAYQ